MPYFVMNRNVSINSTQGACINFRKDKPEFVPEYMRREVEERGAEETEAPDPAEPFEVRLVSVSNTSPVVCTVDHNDVALVKVGDDATVNLEPPKVPFSGKVSAITLDSFTVEGSDLSSEYAPILHGTATITPHVEEIDDGIEDTDETPTDPGAPIDQSGRGEEDDGPPTEQGERDRLMHEAFTKMIEDGSATDAKAPSVKDTSNAVGFQVTAAERDAAWESFKSDEE